PPRVPPQSVPLHHSRARPFCFPPAAPSSSPWYESPAPRHLPAPCRCIQSAPASLPPTRSPPALSGLSPSSAQSFFSPPDPRPYFGIQPHRRTPQQYESYRMPSHRNFPPALHTRPHQVI